MSLPEAKKLRKKIKEELSDTLMYPPEEVHKTRSKNERNCKNPPEEMGLEDGVVGAVDVAGEVVSRNLTSDKVYEFMY